MIKVVAFDFGGVLYTYVHKEVMEQLAAELKQPLSAVCKAWDNNIATYETRNMDSDMFWALFLKELDINYDKKILNKIVLNQFKPIDGTLKILSDLQGGYLTGLISNHSIWLDVLEQKYHFKKSLNIFIVSKDVGVRKPNKEIFNIFIKRAKVKPEEIVFIDDTDSFRESVESVGMKFIYFKNPAQLKRDLKKLGVNV